MENYNHLLVYVKLIELHFELLKAAFKVGDCNLKTYTKEIRNIDSIVRDLLTTEEERA